MTDQERTARLEGIVETWNRVLEEQRRTHDANLAEMRRRGDAITARMDRIDGRMDQLSADVGALRTRVSHMRGWLVGRWR